MHSSDHLLFIYIIIVIEEGGSYIITLKMSSSDSKIESANLKTADKKKNKKKREAIEVHTENSSNNQSKSSTKNENEIGTCSGGLDEDETKKLQDELERAKEESENSFNTKSRCEIQ